MYEITNVFCYRVYMKLLRGTKKQRLGFSNRKNVPFGKYDKKYN